MAKGRKTGGRNFKKGEGGRKKGAKDKIPRGVKAQVSASIKAMYQAMLAHQPELFWNAIERGLKARGPVSFSHTQLAAYFIDGKPVDNVRMLDPRVLSDETLRMIQEDLARADQKTHAGS